MFPVAHQNFGSIKNNLNKSMICDIVILGFNLSLICINKQGIGQGFFKVQMWLAMQSKIENERRELIDN